MIEAERKRLGLSMARLCQAAGIDPRTYGRILAGARQPRRDTLARLEAGLARLRRGERGGAAAGRALQTRMIYRLLLAQLAREAGIDVRAALDHNPQLKATANEEWVRISRLRDVTSYMLNAVLGLPNAEVAKAAGVTPPAIHSALKKVEDKRAEHPDLEAVFSMFEAAVQ